MKITRSGQVRAVSITPEGFKKRSVDFLGDKEKQKLLDAVGGQRNKRRGVASSLEVLRRLRGYE